MKRIILAFVAVVMALNVSAQDLRWGAVGAINFSWEKAKALGIGISSDAYIGFQAGVKTEMDLSDYLMDGFFADGALVYNLKGGSYSGSHTNLGFLEIPLNIGYRLPITNDISMIAGLGPYFGLGVLGKDVAKEGGTKVKTDVFGDSMKRFDFGLNYKLGVEMWNQWQFYLGYEHSLLNLAKTDADLGDSVKCRLSNFFIGTSYMF